STAISPSATGATAAARLRPPDRRPARSGPATGSSTSVFHSPQPGHCPAQRGVSCPHAEQTWIVVARGIVRQAEATASARRKRFAALLALRRGVGGRRLLRRLAFALLATAAVGTNADRGGLGSGLDHRQNHLWLLLLAIRGRLFDVHHHGGPRGRRR